MYNGSSPRAQPEVGRGSSQLLPGTVPIQMNGGSQRGSIANESKQGHITETSLTQAERRGTKRSKLAKYLLPSAYREHLHLVDSLRLVVTRSAVPSSGISA